MLTLFAMKDFYKKEKNPLLTDLKQKRIRIASEEMR